MGQTTDLSVGRLFTPAGSKGYDQIEWSKRDSKLTNPATGEVVFEQNDLEFPAAFSQNAINIVAQKYFTGTPGTKGREASLKTLIDRVVDTVVRQGIQEVGLLWSQRIEASSAITFLSDVEVARVELAHHPADECADAWEGGDLSFFIATKVDHLTIRALFVGREVNPQVITAPVIREGNPMWVGVLRFNKAWWCGFHPFVQAGARFRSGFF